jgi:pimeloyl-ACP methyl ester carboxylesterase
MATAGSYTETCVEAADVRLQLRQGGAGEPLLVLHGELGVPGWLRAYELLAEHFTVYVPSLPGFGQSARPDWIISVRDLAMALVGAAGLKPEVGEIWDYFVHAPREAFTQAFYDPEHVPEYVQYYGKSWTPEEESQVERNREMASRLLWKPYMRSHTLAALLRGIATPTLLVWGREDAIIPLNVCQLYARAIPGATAKIIESCGHMPEMEKPAEFVRVVLDFLTAP